MAFYLTEIINYTGLHGVCTMWRIRTVILWLGACIFVWERVKVRTHAVQEAGKFMKWKSLWNNFSKCIISISTNFPIKVMLSIKWLVNKLWLAEDETKEKNQNVNRLNCLFRRKVTGSWANNLLQTFLAGRAGIKCFRLRNEIVAKQSVSAIRWLTRDNG